MYIFRIVISTRALVPRPRSGTPPFTTSETGLWIIPCTHRAIYTRRIRSVLFRGTQRRRGAHTRKVYAVGKDFSRVSAHAYCAYYYTAATSTHFTDDARRSLSIIYSQPSDSEVTKHPYACRRRCASAVMDLGGAEKTNSFYFFFPRRPLKSICSKQSSYLHTARLL